MLEDHIVTEIDEFTDLTEDKIVGYVFMV